MGPSARDPLGILTLRLFHMEPPAVVTVFLHWHQLLPRFPPLGSLLWLVVATCLPLQSWGSSSPSDLPLFLDLRKVVKFSVYLAFHLLLGWRAEFQSPYMQDQEQEVPKIAFKMSSMYKVFQLSPNGFTTLGSN